MRAAPGDDTVPRIDVAPLVAAQTGAAGAVTAAVREVSRQIDDACRRTGFFSIVGHGVPATTFDRLESAARDFFARPDQEKAAIAMARGGAAWRGWFPMGGELTAGVPDAKEGLYFGRELPADDVRVRRGLPLHGPNLFPEHPAGLRPAVLDYIEQVTAVGHAVLRGLSVALDLPADWFDRHLTADPIVLFRIFRYPPVPPGHEGWSVGEHTDYGLVTLLRQDDVGGLEVRGADGWVAVPPDREAFVVNLGDMVERITGGSYRSTPHRVRNTSTSDRLSFPLFLDPAWDAEVRPVPGTAAARAGDADHRWDGRSVHDGPLRYGDYLLDKVGRVFPDLRAAVLGGGAGDAGDGLRTRP